jgi:molecular chaperone HscC
MKDAALDDVVMTDVAPYSLGLDVAMQLPDGSQTSGHFDPIIERNSPVPISRVKPYVPIRDQQRELSLRVYQGEARLVSENILLGSLKVPLPGLSRAESVVDVRFTYDVNGLLQVEVTVQKTQETVSLIIEGNPGLLSEAEIAERLAALSKLKIHPRDQMENRTRMARAERLYQQLRGREREWFGAQIRVFEASLASQDPRRIDADRQKFAEIVDYVERQNRMFVLPESQT